MIYDTLVNGRAGSLAVSANTLKYQTQDSVAVEGSYTYEAVGPGELSVLLNGRSFRVVVASSDALGKREVSINGRVFQVDVFDPRSLRGRRTEASSGGRQTILAPMPGRVIRVLVEAGQTVEAGQGLIVVEAMKMQNEMKAPKAGVVAQVKTQAGATIAAGETLLMIE